MKNHDFFIKTALLLARKSKCVSNSVGALITKNGRIISTGYNGTPAGYINCCDVFDKNAFNREEHHKWSNINEIHAEMNAILFAAKNGVDINKSTIYCTLEPCHNCLKNIIQSGINEIIYFNKYDKAIIDNNLLNFIKNNNIIYEQYSNDSLLKFEDYISIC